MVRKRLIVLGGGVAGAAALVAVLLPAPLQVDGAAVQTGAMQVTIEDQGEARSHDRFVVAAPVAGRLMRIELHDGDAVVEDQLLARIAPLPLSARERDEIHARVASAEAQQREAEQRVRHADEDLAQARREHERVRKLVADGFLAPQSAEQARNLEVTAANDAQAAGFRAKAAAAEVRVARSGLIALRAMQGADLVQVRAPMSGRILRITDASERAVAAGSPLLTMADVRRKEVVVELLSAEAVKVRPGMPALIDGWGGERALAGTVRAVEPYAVTKVSALGIEEKRVNVIVDFVDSPGAIGDGFRVTARIIVWQQAAVVKVPTNALFRCAAAWCVFTIDGGRARRTEVRIDHRNAAEAEVTGGLSPGQVVIRYPSNEVSDGVRVRVRS